MTYRRQMRKAINTSVCKQKHEGSSFASALANHGELFLKKGHFFKRCHLLTLLLFCGRLCASFVLLPGSRWTHTLPSDPCWSLRLQRWKTRMAAGLPGRLSAAAAPDHFRPARAAIDPPQDIVHAGWRQVGRHISAIDYLLVQSSSSSGRLRVVCFREEARRRLHQLCSSWRISWQQHRRGAVAGWKEKQTLKKKKKRAQKTTPPPPTCWNHES